MREENTGSSTRNCPACGERRSQGRGQKNNFQLLSCQTCATLYTATNPDTDQEEDYDAYYTAENLAVPAFIDSILDGIVATFAPYRKNNRLLDVGCGAGTILEAAARAGWEATGVEISRTAADHVRSLGFEVFCGELDKAAYPDNHFDVIVASEVFEHVLSPRALLEDIARVLRPGGLLWATTPHGRGISARVLGLEWSNVCPPEHLQLFSVAGIKQLLSSAGFRRVELATHGANPFEIVSAIRRRTAGPAPGNGSSEAQSFNRVESGYQLNEFLSDGRYRRLLKGALNSLLNKGRMGDSLKIRAEK